MLKSVFVVAMLGDDGLQPSSSVDSWLNIFVLAGTPDVLRETGVVRHIGHHRIYRRVTIGSSNLFGAGAKLDQTLQQDLDHAIESRAGRFGNVLNEVAAIGGNGRP